MYTGIDKTSQKPDKTVTYCLHSGVCFAAASLPPWICSAWLLFVHCARLRNPAAGSGSSGQLLPRSGHLEGVVGGIAIVSAVWLPYTFIRLGSCGCRVRFIA